jgi:hypothetical protein
MLIGISGKRNAGKTTLANLAVTEFGFMKDNFAFALKNEVKVFILTHMQEGQKFDDAWLWGSNKDKDIPFVLDVRRFSPPVMSEYAHFGFFDFVTTVDGGYITSGRRMLQWYGTNFKRAKNPSYWTEQTMESLDLNHRVIIDDMRFPNEAEAIRQAGGILIRVNRPTNTPATESDFHPSEVALDNYEHFNLTIQNNWDLEKYLHLCRYGMCYILAG